MPPKWNQTHLHSAPPSSLPLKPGASSMAVRPTFAFPHPRTDDLDIAVATAPAGSVFNEAMFTVSGLAPVSGNFVVTAGADHPIPDAAADHANRNAPFVTR